MEFTVEEIQAELSNEERVAIKEAQRIMAAAIMSALARLIARDLAKKFTEISAKDRPF